jgi:hypothetical protein
MRHKFFWLFSVVCGASVVFSGAVSKSAAAPASVVIGPCHALAQVIADGKDLEPRDQFKEEAVPYNPLKREQMRAMLLSRERWTGPPPGHDLVDRLLKSRPAGTAACRVAGFNILEAVPKRDHGRMNEPRGENVPPPAHFVVSATVPVLNRSQDEGLFLVDRKGDAIGGHLKVVYIAKHGTSWRRVGEKFIILS